VKQHFDNAFSGETFKSLSARSVSFSCVDSRSEEPILGTPGGDMSEFMAGVAAYFKLTGTAFSEDAVDALFKAYLAKGFSKKRQVRRRRISARAGPLAPPLKPHRAPPLARPPARPPSKKKRPASKPPALSPRSQFYFHQGDDKMRLVYADVNAATGKNYVAMPEK
jgi:hypothetical protein